MDKCPDCPVATRCLAERTAHVAYCDWARAGGARRDRVIELSARDAAIGYGVGHDQLRPDVSEAMRLTEAARSCPFASRDSACGCSGVLCSLRPASRRLGSLLDCIECQRRYPDPQGIGATHLD